MIFSPRLLAYLLFSLLFFFPAQVGSRESSAPEAPFPLIAGLEESVEFWKLVFTQYSTSELIFFDPVEPTKIYQVLEVGERRKVRRLIRKQRRKIISEHGLKADKKRVRVQRGLKERFASGLELSGRYLEQMQQIFQEQGLPIALVYLPLVESSFNLRARSPAGAVGIWQFMRSTGRRFLRISRSVDERRDPLESTRAAARLLKENYDLFGNWPLAITAYNHGQKGILRAIRKVGSKDLVEIIRRYRSRSFGFASKNFYAEFLAAVEVATRGEEYFPDLEYHPAFPLEELEMERAILLTALLNSTDTPRKEFLGWNPALSSTIRAIPRGYRVKIPADKLGLFLTGYQQAVKVSSIKRKRRSACKSADSWTCHRVRSGETLSQIARYYGSSVSKIQRFNRLVSAHFISAGQYLRIPRR